MHFAIYGLFHPYTSFLQYWNRFDVDIDMHSNLGDDPEENEKIFHQYSEVMHYKLYSGSNYYVLKL